MMIPGFVTIIVIEVSYVWQKKKSFGPKCHRCVFFCSVVDNSSDEYYDETSINHANQDKTNDNDKEKIELLTKELNTLKLAHETILGDHRELLRAHEKLRFEKLNLEQEHEFLKAINDDLRKKSSSYIAKRLLLSTYMPQVKSSNKYKKDTSSSSNNNNVKSNIVASSSSLDSTNDPLSQVHLSKKIAYWRES